MLKESKPHSQPPFLPTAECRPSSVPIAIENSIEPSTFCVMYGHIQRRNLSDVDHAGKVTPASGIDSIPGVSDGF